MLVIDDIDVLVKLEEMLTKRVTEYWLRHQVEQVLDAPGARPLRDLLGELIDQVHTSSGYTQSPIAAPNPLMTRLHELDGWLGGWNRVARACVTAEAQNWLKRLDFRPAESTAAKREDQDRRDEHEQLLLRAAAVRLAGTRKVLSDALRIIADRRSGVRLAVIADKLPDEFLDLPSDQRFVMRLGRLTWLETWRWIRRNLPGLLRYGDDYLERLWPRLGANLELWEELERQILNPAAEAPEIPKIVDEIAPRKPSDRSGSVPGIDPPRGARPLRVAVTGPHIASAEALAFAITRLASEHGVGGRVVAGQENERGLAVLLDVPSPFQDAEAVDEAAIIRFLQAVSDRQPDIVLLDYGYVVRLPLPDSNAHERPLLGRLRQQVLLIAAGGNERAKKVTKEGSAPGVYPEVLTVGSIGGDGQLQPYTEWIPALMKPDIFMPDQLLGTALESALTTESLHGLDQSPLGPGTHGSSFAAIHAVGAAILVWLTLPNLTPDELRHVLRRASLPVATRSAPRPLALTVQAAVAEARQELIDGPSKTVPARCCHSPRSRGSTRGWSAPAWRCCSARAKSGV